MKRLLLFLGLAVMLTGCTSQPPATTCTAAEIGELVVQSQPSDYLDPMHPLSSAYDPAELETYLSTAYGFSPQMWEDAVAAYGEGMAANEVAVIQLSEETDGAAAEQALWRYVQGRLIDFTGYAPEQAALVENALVVRQGQWLLLAICPDPIAAKAAFDQCFQGESVLWTPPPEPSASPVQEEERLEMPRYDTGPVVEAYRTGDTSALSDQDQAVLEACARVMEEVLTADMTPAEQELAIHDWLIDHTAYDEEHSHPNHNHPYGLLVEGRAICMGYANTFQLFMDLLGIPCQTVVSPTHAWNLVELDGAWYGVDVTWDDPLGSYETIPAEQEPVHHAYFNITDAVLWESGHRWDKTTVPAATGTKYTWQAIRGDVPPFRKD